MHDNMITDNIYYCKYVLFFSTDHDMLACHLKNRDIYDR